MFGFIKKMLIVLLTSLVNASNDTKSLSLSNQKREIQPFLINLHPNEYNTELHYHPFAVKLDRCVGRCNTLNDLSNKVCVPNKTEDSNIHAFNIITGINKPKISKIYISRKCKVNLMEENVIQIKRGIMINVDVSVKKIIDVKRLCLESC